MWKDHRAAAEEVRMKNRDFQVNNLQGGEVNNGGKGGKGVTHAAGKQ